MNHSNSARWCIAAFFSFILVLTLAQCENPSGSGRLQSLPASKDVPLVNSLRMKFVRVPGTKILMCTTETTIAQFSASGLQYQSPAFPQASDHPVVNVTSAQSLAWCAWLSGKEGRRYRLPTNSEWSAAVGDGVYPWGNVWPPPNNSGNYCGAEFDDDEAIAFAESQGAKEDEWSVIDFFQDRHVFTAPVGSYPANQLGIRDLGGNVWEWCSESPGGPGKVLRGGSWYDHNSTFLTSAFQSQPTPGLQYNDGFRVVLEE